MTSKNLHGVKVIYRGDEFVYHGDQYTISMESKARTMLEMNKTKEILTLRIVSWRGGSLEWHIQKIVLSRDLL